MESIHSATGFIPCGRCPTCEAAGREVWIFRGRSCYICATYVP
jgi:hypothetical protein